MPPVLRWGKACQNQHMNELPEICRFLSDLPGFEELDHGQLTAAARAIQIGYYKAGSRVLTLDVDGRVKESTPVRGHVTALASSVPSRPVM